MEKTSIQPTSKTSQGALFVLYWLAFWTVVAIMPVLIHNLLLYQTLWKQDVIYGAIIGSMTGIVGGLAQVATGQVAKGWVNDVICWGIAFIVSGLIISLVYDSIVPALILTGIGAFGGAAGGLVYPRFDAFRTPHKILVITLVFTLLAVVAVIAPAYRAIL